MMDIDYIITARPFFRFARTPNSPNERPNQHADEEEYEEEKQDEDEGSKKIVVNYVNCC